MIRQWMRRALVVSSICLAGLVVAPLPSHAASANPAKPAQPQRAVVVKPDAKALPTVFTVQSVELRLQPVAGIAPRLLHLIARLVVLR
jgi:hypothetical protein